MPRALVEREIAHPALTRLHVVLDAGAGAGWVGGGGGERDGALHTKPVGFLNVTGYFDPLFGMIDRMVADGLSRHELSGGADSRRIVSTRCWRASTNTSHRVVRFTPSVH